MGKLLFFLLFVIFLGIVGTGVYLYMHNSSDKIVPVETYSLFLNAKDVDNEIVSVGYIIVLDGDSIPHKVGTTRLDSYEEIQMPINRSFVIYQNSTKYYTGRHMIGWADNMKSGFKTSLELSPVGNLSIIQQDEIAAGFSRFTITAVDGDFRKPYVCLRWSANILTSYINNFQESTIPIRLVNKVDKCFFTDKTLKSGENMTFDINYDIFIPSSDTEVQVFIIDSDLRYYTSEPVFEENNGEDIGASDIISIIKQTN